MKHFSLFICGILLSFQIVAQEKMLQHVDHNSRHAHITGLHDFKGGVIYSTHNDGFPLTRLNYINAEGEHEILTEVFYEHRIVKFYDQEDGTVHIYMCGLFDYDLAIGSIYKYVFDGETLEFINLNYWDYFDYIFDLEVLENGNIYFIKDAYVLQIGQDGTPLDTAYQLSQGNYYDRLFQNKEGEIFLWNKQKVIKLLGNYNSEEVWTVEDEDNEINEIVLAEDNSGIYLGSKNYTKHLGQDFHEIYHYEYPAGYYFKSGLGDYKQDLFFIQLHNDEDKPEIWHNVLPVQELEHAEEYLIAEDEAIKLVFSDTDLILGGTFELVKPTCVIKSFPWFDVAEYDYCDLSLDEFEIYHTSKDTAWTYTNYAGELIVVYDYFYEYHYKVSNLGDEAINHFNVYSSNFTNIFENKLFLSEEIKDGIAPEETREFFGEYETSFALSLAEQAYSFYIPGGDFLKDGDMSNNVQVETIISNVDDFVYEGIEFSIYPNPASSLLNVNTDESNIVSLSLYSLTGEIIYRALNEDISELDISDYREGMYFIELISETGKRGLKAFIIKR